jgi:hypothetical protein
MNYDQWKTMSDRDDSTDMVSPCCGAEYSEYTNYDEYISADYAERRREDAAEFHRDE